MQTITDHITEHFTDENRNGVTVYPEERQQAVTTLISQRGRMSVADLSDTFGVTTETVRRDLALLERLGHVRRVHGGAVPAGSSPSPSPA